MMRTTYQPGAAADDVTVSRQDEHWTLVFVRELAHPPEKVWRALTDPAELAQWAPFDPDRDLSHTGAATLTMAGPEPDALPSQVRRAEPPALLEYTWGDDVLRWELDPTATGTRLTLKHTMGDRSWLSQTSAGWHICLDVMDQWLRGDPVGRIVADEAKRHGWGRLNEEYAARFGA